MRDADLKAEVISNSNPNRVAMVSKVVSGSVLDSMTEDGKLRYWTVVHKLDSLRSGEDGKIRSTTTSTFTAVLRKKARFNAGQLRAYRESEGDRRTDKVQSDKKPKDQ